MNKLSLNKILPKKTSKGEGTSIKLPKGLKVNQLALILTSVILLALTIFFAVSYLQGSHTKNNLTNEIQQKTRAIAANQPKSISELVEKLNDSVMNLSQNAPFPASVDNKEIASQLIQVAKDDNILLDEYIPPTASSTLTIGTIPYLVETYIISAKTQPVRLQKIITFLQDLEDLPYPTSYIDGLSFSYDSTTGFWTFGLNFKVILLNQQ